MARVKNAPQAKNTVRNVNRRSKRALPRYTQSIRNSQQCESDTLKKKRCRKRTAHTPQCWIHLAKEKNLRIKKSNIPNAGKGLFTWKKPIRRGKNIDFYTGVKTSRPVLDVKYGKNTTAEYALCNGPNLCIDAFLSTHGAPRFTNDARGSKYKNNSHFTFDNRYNNFNLKSSKYIKPHQEIFSNYGEKYWPRGYFKK